MPVIARRAIKKDARFYWHLGDLRAMYEVDEDYAGLHRKDPAALTMDAYVKAAWDDFKQNQIKPFGKIPFLAGHRQSRTDRSYARSSLWMRFTINSILISSGNNAKRTIRTTTRSGPTITG